MYFFRVYCVIAGAPVEIASGIDIVSANYLLDDVECTGNETDISQCKKREWGVHNCIPDQKEFASVTCIPLKNERPPGKPNIFLWMFNFNSVYITDRSKAISKPKTIHKFCNSIIASIGCWSPK